MGLYLVRLGTKIIHDDVTYCAGEEIMLTDDEAKAMASSIEPIIEQPEVSTCCDSDLDEYDG